MHTYIYIYIICMYIHTYIYPIFATRSYTYTRGHPRMRLPPRLRTHTRARRRRRRAQRPRRIDDPPSASRRGGAPPGPKAAHTTTNVVTDAVFHAPMFALNAVAAMNACEPSHPQSTPPEGACTCRRGCVGAQSNTHTHTRTGAARGRARMGAARARVCAARPHRRSVHRCSQARHGYRYMPCIMYLYTIPVRVPSMDGLT